MSRSKIETSLSEDALQDFCKTLAATPNLTLKKLQSMAAERGIEVSLMGARTFRDGAFKEHLERLRKARDLARQVAEFNNSDAAGTLADAGAAVLMQKVFDEMTAGAVDVDVLSKIIARWRSGDHRQRELNAKLQLMEKQIAEYERRDREREERKAELSKAISKGLGKATLREIEEKIKLL